MKLHDALRKIFRLFGINVLQEKRLVFLLADYKAFDDCPAMEKVIEAIAAGRYGKEFCLRLADDGSADYELYKEYLGSPLCVSCVSGKNSPLTLLTASPMLLASPTQ